MDAREVAAMREETARRVRRLLDGAGIPPLVAPGRVAVLLDVGRSRVYELVAMGELEAMRVGKRRMRVTRDSLERLLARDVDA